MFGRPLNSRLWKTLGSGIGVAIQLRELRAHGDFSLSQDQEFIALHGAIVVLGQQCFAVFTQFMTIFGSLALRNVL